MVVQSNRNYVLHKKQVHAYVKQNFGIERADKFINYYSEVYDEYNRSFIHYKLAIALMDDISYCKNIGTRWYAYVGIGGTGKSTIAKNVSYFLDPTFTHSRLSVDIKTLINTISTLPFREQKALFMDEPDDSINANSMDGKVLRKIFGKIRQQHLHIGICATDLKDIPPYIFRKLDGVFFTPYLGACLYVKNRPKKKEYLLQELRFNYDKMGYKIFFNLKNKSGCLQFRTHKATPIDKDSKQYLANKEADYKNDLNNFVKGVHTGPNDRDKIILKLNEQKKTHQEISKLVGVSRVRITQIVSKYKDKSPVTVNSKH